MIYLVFFLGLGFLFLPFIPTLIEVRKKTDAAPLKITNHILRDPRSSPELLFWHFSQLLGLDGLKKLEENISVTETRAISDSILAIPGGKIQTLTKNIARVISAHSIELLPKTSYPSKILSLKSIHTAPDNALNEVHALEKLTLAPRNKVVWWASGDQVEIQDQTSLPGKIQAVTTITLAGRIRFHLLEAPSIKSLAPVTLTVSKEFSKGAPLKKVKEDFEIKDNEVLHATLIVKGKLTIGKNAKILGNVKVHKKLVMKEGAQILGNLVGISDIELQGKNLVTGSLLTQETLDIGPNSQVGTPSHQVTCSAKEMNITGPFQAHGLLRAWKSGSFQTAAD